MSNHAPFPALAPGPLPDVLAQRALTRPRAQASNTVIARE